VSSVKKLNNYLEIITNSIKSSNLDSLDLLYKSLDEKFIKGGRIFIAGNGGSSAIASHAVTDLNKLNNLDFRLNAISLVENIPLITATSNDYGYENLFVENIKNHNVNQNDILICISSSGNSLNVINLINYCKDKKMKTFSLLGFDGGKCLEISDHSILISTPTGYYGPVEDIHMMIFHIYVHIVKNDIFK